MDTTLDIARSNLDLLDGWVNELAMPLRPLIAVSEPDGSFRLEFRNASAQALLVGKLVRATSGLRAAFFLADAGYVAESAALLRMVSDFCTEVTAVAEGLYSGSTTNAVRQFVENYFAPRARTPEELEAREKARYVSREELMKAEGRLAARSGMDPERLTVLKRFLNHTFDAYVHGAYETSTELYNANTGLFMMRGNESESYRHNHLEAAAHKMHEVVTAIEFTAKLAGNVSITAQAAAVRRALNTGVGPVHGSRVP